MVGERKGVEVEIIDLESEDKEWKGSTRSEK